MTKLLSIAGSDCRLISTLILRRFAPISCHNSSRAHFCTQSDPNDEYYDIVVNGGGIVGFATLLALKRSPFLSDKRICLFEKQTKPKELYQSNGTFSNRVSSITKSSKKLLEDIGAWNELKDCAKPIKEFYVWSQKYQNGINFRTDLDSDRHFSDDNVCYVIENNKILSSLERAIRDLKLAVDYETVVTDIRSDEQGIRIDTKELNTNQAKRVRTRLLIGCDGFQSIVRQKSNLDLFEHDLNQFGIVGTVAVDSGDGNLSNDVAFQRFVPFDRSVIALLPLNQQFSSFVWSVPKDSAKHLMELSEHQFIDQMNDSLFVESNEFSNPIISKIDDLISGLLPQELALQTTRYAIPHVVSLVTDSRAMFPFKFSTTVPYLVGSPSDSEDNNRVVIIGW